jgi:alkyl hydroperoxide reductase subunit F
VSGQAAGNSPLLCASCNARLLAETAAQRVDSIVGGGDSALEAAIEMSGIAAHVSIISRGDWTGDAILQDKVSATDAEVLTNYEPAEIHGEERVTGLTVNSRPEGTTRHLQVDGVFIEIGLAASSDYALDLLETNARGEIQVDRELETGVRGVFAAGDVNDGRDKQVIIAAAEGAKAALAAFGYLIHQA